MSRFHLSAMAVAMLSFAASSCGPEAYLMSLETRGPSESGIDLGGKTISVVYLEQNAPYDTAFTYHIADGFAKKIEDDYFDGERGVNVFKLPKESGVYSAKDTLVSLVMDTGDDVVFVIDAPQFSTAVKDQNTGKWTVPFGFNLYGYDSMGKNDTVLSFSGKSVLEGGDGPTSDSIWKVSADQGYTAGYSSAVKFSPTWVNENVHLIYFSSDEWVDALDKAYEMDWKAAIEKWMKLAASQSPMKRTCAAYNVAVGCYIMGDITLAEKWLEISDQDGPVSYSKELRNKIAKVRK